MNNLIIFGFSFLQKNKNKFLFNKSLYNIFIMKSKIIICLSIFIFLFNIFKAQSQTLTPFTNTNIMGCSCYILEKNKYFENNRYLGVVDFSGEWQDRKLEVKLGNRKIQLRIDNTNVKSNHFGRKKYFEIYKDDIYNMEIRIDYNKTKSAGYETDLYNIIMTIKQNGKTRKIITKGFCGC